MSKIQLMLVGIITLFFIGAGTIVLTVRNNQSTLPLITPTPISTRTITPSVTSQTSPDVSDPNAKTINGIAYLSPNSGEGLSIKYTEVIDGTTYYPFQPLHSSVPPGEKVETKIINKAGKNIQLSDISPGDKLAVIISRGPCVMAVNGAWSGCIVKLYSIQDLTR